MTEQAELYLDLSDHQESGHFDVSDEVSPFELPERRGPVVDLIQERLGRAYEFTRQQRGHFRTGHYPLQLKRWRADANYDFTAMELTVEPGSEGESQSSIITIKKSRKKEKPDKRFRRFKAASLPLDESVEQDPDISEETTLRTWLEEQAKLGYFMTYGDRETLEGSALLSEQGNAIEYLEPEAPNQEADHSGGQAQDVETHQADDLWGEGLAVSAEDLDGFHEETVEDLQSEEPILFEQDNIVFHDDVEDIFVPENALRPEEDPLVESLLLKGGADLEPLKWEPLRPSPNVIVGTNGYSDQSKSILEEDYSQESQP